MIDNRKYTVEAQALVEAWYDERFSVTSTLSEQMAALDDLVSEVERAMESAHRNGFQQGLSQQASEKVAKESEALSDHSE